MVFSNRDRQFDFFNLMLYVELNVKYLEILNSKKKIKTITLTTEQSKRVDELKIFKGMINVLQIHEILMKACLDYYLFVTLTDAWRH